MDFVHEYQAQNCANTRDSPQQIPRVSVRLLGRPEDGELHVAEQGVVVPQQGQSHLDAFLHRRSGAPLRDANTVGLLGNLLTKRGQVVLAVGVLDMGQSLGALAHQAYPAPEEITGRTHLSGRDVGLREHAPTQEHRDFLRIDTVVFGCAAVDGLHGEGMPEDDGKTLPSAQVSQPVPREETCDRDDYVVTIRRKDLEQGLGAGRAMLVHHDRPIAVQDADGHRPGVEINPTVRFVLFGVESHAVSSSLASEHFLQCQHTTVVC